MKVRSLVIAVVLAFVGGFALNAVAEEHFSLDDIPEIKNKKPIHVALEAGGGSDLIFPFLEKFSEKTGIKFTVAVTVIDNDYGIITCRMFTEV